jgi:hypothetical protein
MTAYSKAIAAFIVGLIVTGLTYFHYVPGSDVTNAVSTLVTTAVVYFVTNK